MDTDENVYISFLDGDDQLLIPDEFSGDRRQIFTMEGMQGLEEAGILVEHEDKANETTIGRLNEAQAPLLDATTEALHEGIPISKHFLLSGEDSQFMVTNEDQDASSQISSQPGEVMGYFEEHMDIRAPVAVLRNLLYKRLGTDFSDYEFWLQNTQKLEPHRNLVDQCVQGEGLVQINVALIETEGIKRINIVDVLKPTEEYLIKHKQKSKIKPGLHWIVDDDFRKELKQLRIPEDPRKWSREHVKHWLMWAVRQFNLTGIKLSDWMMTGKELCDLTFDAFKEKCKRDKGGVFWTHLELLRQCDLLAVVAKDDKGTLIPPAVKTEKDDEVPSTKIVEIRHKETFKRSRVLGSNQAVTERRSAGGYSKAGSGQIQLWQFLLELLTDWNHLFVIHWVSSDGEFKLENPDRVAKLWGERKNKPTMSYEKLSRALRYYYDGDMISKVHGKRFVYKFVCDLKELLGYSPSELNALVVRCAIKNGVTPSASFLQLAS